MNKRQFEKQKNKTKSKKKEATQMTDFCTRNTDQKLSSRLQFVSSFTKLVVGNGKKVFEAMKTFTLLTCDEIKSIKNEDP